MSYAFTVFSLALLSAVPAWGQALSSGIRIGDRSASPIKLPAKGDIPSLLLYFEYEKKEIPKAVKIDLNGDKILDYIVEASARLCGNGGCPYALIDGATWKRLGDFLGSPIFISERKINGYPVISSYGHMSATSGNYFVYVFDGNCYAEISRVYLTGEAVDTLFANLQGFKEFSLGSSLTTRVETGIDGQVYSVGSPAVPIDWTPPPLQRVSTIVVVDDRHKSVSEFQTDEKGKFKIALPPGSYFLSVKESEFSAETGPFRVNQGEVTTARAHYDNGMR